MAYTPTYSADYFRVPKAEYRVYLVLAGILAASLIAAWVADDVTLAFTGIGLIILPLIALNLKVGWYFTFGLVVISQEMVVPYLRVGLQIPTEPMLLFILFVWISGLVLTGETMLPMNYIDRPIYTLFGLLTVSILISTYPLVTFKSMLNTMWYVGIGYFFLKNFFRTIRDIKRVVMLLLLLATTVAAIVLVRHSLYGFTSATAASLITIPFFPEHGSYAAYISFAFAMSVSLMFASKYLSKSSKVIVYICAPTTLLGVIFSYTRGAWLGVCILILFLLFAKFRRLISIRGVLIVVALVLITIGGISYSGARIILEKSVTSIFKVESSVSNLERLNRWWAAVDIFRSYPIAGAGYGTYAQNYFAHRNILLQTFLSGRMIRAHNEYLTVLAELGLIGALIFGWLLYRIFRTGIRVFFESSDPVTKHLALGAIGGILTYLVHGFFNSFLEFDKVAFPFWTLVGILAVLDLTVRRRTEHLRFDTSPNVNKSI